MSEPGATLGGELEALAKKEALGALEWLKSLALHGNGTSAADAERLAAIIRAHLSGVAAPAIERAAPDAQPSNLGDVAHLIVDALEKADVLLVGGQDEAFGAVLNVLGQSSLRAATLGAAQPEPVAWGVREGVVWEGIWGSQEVAEKYAAQLRTMSDCRGEVVVVPLYALATSGAAPDGDRT